MTTEAATSENTDLLVEVRDGVGILTLNRPDKRNSVSPALIEAMLQATLRFERDSAVRAVLIRGTGDTFMSGGDLAGFRDALRDDREGYLAGMEARIVVGHLMIHRLRRMSKPVVVAVQGSAIGYGLGLMCAADYAIAADDAVFAVAHRHFGLTSDGGVSYFLPRLIGERRATEMALFGERISAERALDWGLINRLTAKIELQDTALEIATALAAGPTRALAGAKALFRTAFDVSWEEQSAREAESLALMIATDDHQEGVTAFFGRRPPHFTGR